MKTLIIGAMALTLAAGSAATAQPNHRGDRHDPMDHRGGASGWGSDRGARHRWARGERMGRNDWQRARRVDYRQHRLRAPPRGYEWRESNGQYVLAAVATGLIASIIIANSR